MGFDLARNFVVFGFDMSVYRSASFVMDGSKACELVVQIQHLLHVPEIIVVQHCSQA